MQGDGAQTGNAAVQHWLQHASDGRHCDIWREEPLSLLVPSVQAGILNPSVGVGRDLRATESI